MIKDFKVVYCSESNSYFWKNDIIVVKLKPKLLSFIGRIAEINTNGLLLDVSHTYNSETMRIDYQDIDAIVKSN